MRPLLPLWVMTSLILIISCQRNISYPLDDHFLKADSSTLTIGVQSGAIDSFKISSNVNWKILVTPASQNWFRISPDTGSGDHLINISTLSPNTSDSIRSAAITITATNASTLQPVVISIHQNNSQNTAVLRNAYGGKNLDDFVSAILMNDGGLISVGGTQSADGDITGNHGSSDFWLVRTDKNGKVIWSKTYGGKGSDIAIKILPTPDGNYVVAGDSESQDGDRAPGYGRIWMFKIDTSGKILWQHSYGGSSNGDQVSALANTSDGGLIFFGTTSSTDGDVVNNHGYGDMWIVKTNGTGDIVWTKTIGGSTSDFGADMVVLPDG